MPGPTVELEHEGFGIFRPGEDEPEDLEEVVPRLGERDLEDEHLGPVRAVSAQRSTAWTWMLVGLGGMGAGAGIVAAVGDDRPAAQLLVGVPVMAFGLVAVVVGVLSQPSLEDAAEAGLRRSVFLGGEDQAATVRAGVDRLNQARRDHCVGAAGGE